MNDERFTHDRERDAGTVVDGMDPTYVSVVSADQVTNRFQIFRKESTSM